MRANEARVVLVNDSPSEFINFDLQNRDCIRGRFSLFHILVHLILSAPREGQPQYHKMQADTQLMTKRRIPTSRPR